MKSQHANSQTRRLAIWSPGTFTSLSGDTFTFTAEDLAAIAEGYSPSAFAAPLVKGHPATDDPAQGWVERLEWDGEYLWAEAGRIDPVFAEEARAGRYAKVSPRFFLPDEPGNPTPGRYYLRHVGLLGAAAPANKGLPMAGFSEGQGTVTFADGPALPDAAFADAAPAWGFGVLRDIARRVREWLLVHQGRETADELVPEHLIGALDQAADPDEEPASAGFAQPLSHPPSEEEPMKKTQTPEAAFAERQAQLERERAELEAERQRLAEQQQAARRAECAAFAEQLVREGRIAPALQTLVAALLASIPEEASCAFAENGAEVTVATGAGWRQFLQSLPPRIDYQERTPQGEPPASAAFAAPAGYSVDPASADLYARAKAYAAEHNVDFDTALAAVGGKA